MRYAGSGPLSKMAAGTTCHPSHPQLPNPHIFLLIRFPKKENFNLFPRPVVWGMRILAHFPRWLPVLLVFLHAFNDLILTWFLLIRFPKIENFNYFPRLVVWGMRVLAHFPRWLPVLIVILPTQNYPILSERLLEPSRAWSVGGAKGCTEGLAYRKDYK